MESESGAFTPYNETLPFVNMTAKQVNYEPAWKKPRYEEDNLKLRTCTHEDLNEKLYEPGFYEWDRERLSTMIDGLMCIENLNLINLKGQYRHDDGRFLKITLETCNDTNI